MKSTKLYQRSLDGLETGSPSPSFSPSPFPSRSYQRSLDGLEIGSLPLFQTKCIPKYTQFLLLPFKISSFTASLQPCVGCREMTLECAREILIVAIRVGSFFRCRNRDLFLEHFPSLPFPSLPFILQRIIN